jgi:outer membrane receptor for ferrienterochelin and colicin
MVNLNLNARLSTLLALGAFLLGASAQAQSTTASIRVEVADETGAPIAGLAVTVTHLPTAQSLTFVTNAQGVIVARGLAIGGPYEITLPPDGSYAADKVEDIRLELDETEVIALVARPSASEEISVTADAVGDEVGVGVGHDFDTMTIEAIPSITRDFISTLATAPTIVVDPTVDRGPAVSMAGQNFRFNNVTIDGVAQNDNFGLHMNASATQRTPISIDAVEALNANIAPFDVSYGNFIGGNINIVTKSGGNVFKGGVFVATTDDSLTGDESDGNDLGIASFDELTYGATVGGPVVKDQLFFFANYEKFDTTRPSNTQTIDNIAGVTQADVDRAIGIFQNVYGFDPGSFDATDDDQDEKMLLKLSWNLGDRHRVVGSYQVADGDVIFDDFPEVAVLQSNRYNINEKLTAYSLQAFSTWTDRLSTEFRYGIKDVENRQVSVDQSTPDFSVAFAPFGPTRIAAGGDRFRHANELDNESELFRLRGDFQAGSHLITAGVEQEKYTVRNEFLPFSNGNYVFFSLDDLAARNPGFVLYGNSNTGVAGDAETNFELAVNSVYVQDEWSTGNFTLKLGLRYDFYENSDEVVFNPYFTARNGFSNQENLDGKDLLLPRIGFNWAPTERLTIRGGAGLFGGGTPLIMLSNSYAGNGITRTFASFLAPFFGPPISDAIAAAAAQLPDPTAAFRNFQPFIGVNPQGDVDAIDPDFEILSTWKYHVGAEYDFGDHWLASAGVIYSDVKNGYDIYEGRRRQVGTAPDGRPIYDAPAGGDYIVTNTSEGKGLVLTAMLAKTFYSEATGIIDMNVGYTRQDIDEIRSYNRFVGFETYAFDPQTDLNNPTESTSTFEIKDRITATFSWRKEIFGEHATSIGLTYAGRSGRHFSYVFGSNGVPTFGGTFLADFGSEGDNAGAELFYVPTGTNDPRVTGDPAFLADLDAFIAGDECLSSHRGGIVPRNACETGWVNIVSLHLQQEIRAWGETAFDVYLDIENFGNLVNSDWGQVQSYVEPGNVAPANVAIEGGRYVLTPTASYNGTPDTIVPDPVTSRLPSAYRIQAGLRFRF